MILEFTVHKLLYSLVKISKLAELGKILYRMYPCPTLSEMIDDAAMIGWSKI